MSGGHFNYRQYQLEELASDLEDLIELHNIPDEFGYTYDLEEDAIDYAKKAIKLLNRAQVIIHRLDWLISGDDGVETFRELIKKELEEQRRDE